MNKIAKATIGLMIAMMIAKLLGFVREMVLASSYGASMYSDAYLVSMNIPLVILNIIGMALSTILIPMYCEINKNHGDKQALKFINNIINIVIVICIILSIIGIIFTEPIVKLFAIGFKGNTFKVAVDFTRVLLISMTFTALSYIMTAYLQIKNNFTIPGLISVPKNIIIIISIIISVKYNPYIMIWGTLIGILSELLFQLPFAIKENYKYEFYINIKDDFIKKSILLSIPVLIGVSVNQINTMVDRTLASTLTEGSISALNYANKLTGFVWTLFITSISSVIYPMLSKLVTEDNKEEFKQFIKKSVNSIIILVLPISIGAIVLANPIVKLLFQRGAFDSNATNMTAIALAMYSIGMLGSGLRELLGKVFYSLKDTKTPMINGMISMVINILLNLILIKYLKIVGLAISTSIAFIICAIMLFISLNKKIGYFEQDKIIITFLKSMVASFIMGITVYFIYNKLIILRLSEFICLIISIFMGVIVYGILLIAFKVDEINLLKDIFKQKINRFS